MVWRIPIWKWGSVLSVGCAEPLWQDQERASCAARKLLDQYQQQWCSEEIYSGISKCYDQTGDWTFGGRGSHYERNSSGAHLFGDLPDDW